MKLKRYYLPQQLQINNTYTLQGEEFHHLANVMRTKVGDKVELFCGDAFNYIATVKSIDKKQATLLVDDVYKNTCEPKIKLDVYQALSKGDKLSLITQKITELGASNICIFYSKFCDVKPNTGKLDKLSAVSVNACKQCGRSCPVNVQGVLDIKEIAQKIKNYDKFYVLYEAEEKDSFKNHLLKLVNCVNKNIAIMIGAEGGFMATEIEMLKKAGAIIVGLGNRILRTETAGIACTALVMQLLE